MSILGGVEALRTDTPDWSASRRTPPLRFRRSLVPEAFEASSVTFDLPVLLHPLFFSPPRPLPARSHETAVAL